MFFYMKNLRVTDENKFFTNGWGEKFIKESCNIFLQQETFKLRKNKSCLCVLLIISFQFSPIFFCCQSLYKQHQFYARYNQWQHLEEVNLKVRFRRIVALATMIQHKLHIYLNFLKPLWHIDFCWHGPMILYF